MPGGGYNAAEESVIGNTVTEEVTEQESGEGTQESDGEETAADSAVEKTEDTEKPVENSAAEGQEKPAGPAAEDEGAGMTGSNGVQPDEPAALQKAVRAAGAAAQSEDNIASGEGWTLSADGKLTIESDTGMAGWSSAKETEDLVLQRNNVTTVEINESVTYLV